VALNVDLASHLIHLRATKVPLFDPLILFIYQSVTC